MTRILHTLALAALILLTVLSLDVRLAQVLADAQADCNKGSGDTAIRVCTRIIKSRRLYGKPISQKNLAIIHYNRGIEYANKRDYDLAIADYSKAINLNPAYASAYNNRGNVYKNKLQYDRAISDYDKAIKLEPKHVFAHNGRGNAYKAKGQYDRAIADYNKALKLIPKSASPYGNRGLIFEELEQRDKAIADFRKAVKLRSGDRVGTSGLKRLDATH